ncbi:MAG: recombinase family protein [Bacteroidales bacterium]|jgi:DNA invertase Pin-like site-specific DNA recombinase|nr:recombinase family protein [Bacteroidales bacterium]MCI1785227.1 recombinase family protein [Bacteroidales bacterium]
MIVAYLRVSTEKQTLENQQNEISRFAKENNLTVDKWIAEVVSGKKDKSNRKLGMLLRRLKPNDTLIVTELSRLSRTLTEIMSIMGSLLKKKVRLYSTKDNYFFDDSINSKVLCFAFGLVTEIERNLIAARTREALELRKEQGVALGRPKGSCSKLKNLIDSKKEIKYQLEHGNSINSLCKKYDVSSSTFYSFKRRYLYPDSKKP